MSSPRGVVVELASGDVAAGYCTRVLRAIGFRVVKVEPPGGDPLRRLPPLLDGLPADQAGAMFQYLDAGKHSVVADPSDPLASPDVAALVAAADVVVLAADGDADRVDALQRTVSRRSGAVRVVTSPFGLTGPYRNLPRTDLTDWAASGYMYITGDPDREPLQGGGPFVASATGLVAAIGGLAAWRDLAAGGPSRLVDVSSFDVMAGLHQYTISQYTQQGFVKRRASNRHPEAHHPVSFLECADGWVCICAPSPGQWSALAAAVGMPELAEDPRFQTAGERYDHADEVDALLRPWLMAHTAAQVAAAMQAAHVPASPVITMSEVLGDHHLRARGFLHDVAVGGRTLTIVGASVRIGEPPPWTAAPALGADDGRLEALLEGAHARDGALAGGRP